VAYAQQPELLTSLGERQVPYHLKITHVAVRDGPDRQGGGMGGCCHCAGACVARRTISGRAAEPVFVTVAYTFSRRIQSSNVQNQNQKYRLY
jgi:hypothetical protein